MFNNLKIVGGVLALTLLPMAANASPTAPSYLGLGGGEVNPQASRFADDGRVEFTSNNSTWASSATGIFSSVTTSAEADDDDDKNATKFTLYDIDFDQESGDDGQLIYEGGGFSFRALSFSQFDNDDPGRSFTANGVISGNDIEDISATLYFSTQPGLPGLTTSSSSTVTAPVPVPAAGFLLVGALGGLGALSRRRKS